MTSAVIEVEHLYKVFGRKPQEVIRRLKEGADRSELTQLGTAAVIDASFTVDRGEFFVVMGLSGSGKSTLIRMLNGLNEPTAGSVSIFGHDLSDLDPKELRALRRKRISMVFQHFALLPNRTVLENAAYGLEVQGVDLAERTERAITVLERVGLRDWASKYPGELSGGMQQRVGLARALAADTDILLMDEAFSALDPLIRREMQEQLLDLQEDLKKTIVFITHDLNEAMFLGDRVAVMRDGRIVQSGTPEDILTDPANDYVAQFVQDVDRARVLTARSVMEPILGQVQIGSGPRTALRLMREQQIPFVFVLDRGRKYRGVVSDRDATRLIKDGVTDLSSVVQPSITVGPDELLADLVRPSVISKIPLGVVDDHGRLLGGIPRATLLASLGSVPATTQAIDVITPEVRALAEGDTLTEQAHAALQGAIDSGGEPRESVSIGTGATADAVAAPEAAADDREEVN
ncbi:quaternary amine ABC transporter ATP-binding protein [Pseudoclavibacter sp. CFCC 11306]|uniref:quaternary amine ABC transporter ATP-binding protein n=1 Tax=Pseudoclavibacter sp. CFCC 11306 TaxID=1564493 RepID=UPI00130149D9|nr:glycine betaine/L-proline ABC transporter ATP-binding protein [Pseudoclavibacter sp. CFCC 11306]KAB1659076.1 glycine betaine/L-proline ABC transporter ATP-binding protein [Pseudoclavibacter sp. CFCC 11306]